METPRTARLAQQLQEEIALIIHQELKDPRLGFVTITRVELSKDISHAKVFFSCLGSEDERVLSQEALNHSTRFVYGLLRKRLRLKIIPEVMFRYDESIARAIEMTQMFDRLKQQSESPKAETE